MEKLFSAYPYFSHGNILVKDDQTFEKPAMTLFLLSVYFFAIVDHFESRQYLTWRWTLLGRSRSRRIKASSTVIHPPPCSCLVRAGKNSCLDKWISERTLCQPSKF